LVIGTELGGTIHRPEWRQVISDVRRIYSGTLLYSAHWDGYKNVPFWDDLDGVGIGVYFPEREFVTRAQEAKDFVAQLNKKLYLLEVGCQSVANAGNTPWWTTGAYDEQAQADYYQLVFDNFEMFVPTDQFYQYLQQDCAISAAMPSVQKEEREFILSGTSPEGWKELW